MGLGLSTRGRTPTGEARTDPFRAAPGVRSRRPSWGGRIQAGHPPGPHSREGVGWGHRMPTTGARRAGPNLHAVPKRKEALGKGPLFPPKLLFYLGSFYWLRPRDSNPDNMIQSHPDGRFLTERKH